MGTKNNPGKFDCYENAEPDEPMFVLLGRDPIAPALVERWADDREAKGGNAEKIAEARACAHAMARWYSGERPTQPNFGFHFRNGFYWRRLDDGSVLLTKTTHWKIKYPKFECHLSSEHPLGPEIADWSITIDPASWCSIIAAVSPEHDGEHYAMAVAVHGGDICTLEDCAVEGNHYHRNDDEIVRL